MSIEGTNSNEQQTAMELLESSSVLKDDSYARRVIERGGLTDHGHQVDMGHFLAAREAFLVENGDELARIKNLDLEAAAAAEVVHSDKNERKAA